jgi:tRNA threonylcarbamoyladenosine biosynthesis protein TsaB
MKVLAVDTATRSCSVAVTDGERLSVELTATAARTHTAHLMAMVDQALRLACLEPSSLDGFAVTLGPGSFTGLRIGISTVKGLAFALGRPAVGVSSLAALASQAQPWSGLVCALLDARRGEVYAGLFQAADPRMEPHGAERVLPPEDLVAEIRDPCLFVGDGAERHQSLIRARLGGRAHFLPGARNIIHAASVAALARLSLGRPGEGNLDRLRPRYVRPSEVERKGPAAGSPRHPTD